MAFYHDKSDDKFPCMCRCYAQAIPVAGRTKRIWNMGKNIELIIATIIMHFYYSTISNNQSIDGTSNPKCRRPGQFQVSVVENSKAESDTSALSYTHFKEYQSARPFTDWR